MIRPIAGVGILIFLLLSLPAHAGVPLDTVQANVNKVLDVLRDPALKAESAKDGQKRKTSADLRPHVR